VFVPTAHYIPESVAYLAHQWFGTTTFTIRPIVLHAVVMAIFGSLIAPFGGFFASAIKRAYNKKDFDNIFPGHGGFTDRTDCQYITGLFVYVYYQMFIKASLMDFETVLDGALALSLEEQMSLLNKLNETITHALAHNASV
jgi:phosphatidate cytidylyltransferase